MTIRLLKPCRTIGTSKAATVRHRWVSLCQGGITSATCVAPGDGVTVMAATAHRPKTETNHTGR